MKTILTTLIIFLISYWGTSQQRYQLRDVFSNEAIPFAKVIGPQTQLIADIDGYFEVNPDLNESVTIRSIGYRDTLIELKTVLNGIILLTPSVHEVNEVTVHAGENPAHRIIALAIENRKQNSPTENNAFQYESYSKLNLAFDPAVLDSFPADTKDSTVIELRKFMNSNYLFLVESTSTRKFKPQHKNKEIITSYKVSGFQDPMFSTIFNEMQSFSFYENQFELLGVAYINPIAFGGINRYLFILEDTTFVGKDTIFTISFRPRKGKLFDGMKGQLFINTNGYAIEKVIAEPAIPSESINVKIIQEYQFIDGKKWFPVKLSSELAFPGFKFPVNNKNMNLTGKGSTYISNIVLDPPLTHRDFDQISIETAPDAGQKSEQEWDSARVYQLTEMEKNTYRLIDSVSKAEHFERFLNAGKILATGKVPLGYINLDLRYLLNYNLFEGYRLGAGIETSEKLMKRITVGGNFGYGFHDKAWKYGGFTEFNLYPKRNLFLKMSYQHDVAERGGNQFHRTMSVFNSSETSRRLYIQNMDYQRMAEVLIKGYLLPRIQFNLFANYQRIYLTENYRYQPVDSTIRGGLGLTHFDLAELGFECSWQFKEEILQIGYKRVSLGSKFPVLIFKAAKGMKGIYESDYDYLRLNASLFQQISLRGFGKLNWQINASKTIGSVPLFLLQNAPGTNGKYKVSIPNTFETMLPSSFYSDQQINVFTRLTLLAWKTKLKWFAPQLSLHHAIGFGSMKHPSEHSVSFKTLEKGYYEGGIVLDKLYISGMTGIGAGIFTNYGPYALPQFEKNLVYKLSVSFVF